MELAPLELWASHTWRASVTIWGGHVSSAYAVQAAPVHRSCWTVELPGRRRPTYG